MVVFAPYDMYRRKGKLCNGLEKSLECYALRVVSVCFLHNSTYQAQRPNICILDTRMTVPLSVRARHRNCADGGSVQRTRLQDLFDGLQQPFIGEGLSQVAIGALAQVPTLVKHRIFCTDHDDRNAPLGIDGAQLTAEPKATDAWEDDIQDDAVGTLMQR